MLFALTVSHAEVPLGRLADLSARLGQLSDGLARANQAHEAVPLNGWALLNTCNRVELYVDTERFHDGIEVATTALQQETAWSTSELRTSLQVRSGTPAVSHLFRVASGLESMVLGEAEITGQVRRAFNEALHDQSSTPMLNDLFQQALRTAKRVSSSTALGRAGRSSAEVVLDTAAAQLGVTTLTGQKVLVVGSGAYSRVICAELATRRVADVGVHSASGRRSKSVDQLGFAHVTAADLGEWLDDAGLVIACSGQGTPTITVDALAGRAAAAPLVIMDMALQSDVGPGVEALAGVQVLGLNSLAAGAAAASETALAEATAVVGDGVERFNTRQKVRLADPVIVRMRGFVRDLIAEEVDSLRGRLTDQTVAEVERSLRRVYRKVLHSPTITAQRHAEQGTSETYLQALHTVMGIDMFGAEQVPLIDAEALSLDLVQPDQPVQPDQVDADRQPSTEPAPGAEHPPLPDAHRTGAR